MRVNATLTALQKAGGDALCRIVLTKHDSTVYTYGLDTTDRILNLSHTEQEYSQTAQVTVNDSSGTLAALTLEGCSGVISYGYGSTYSACAPLEVIASKTDSLQGRIVTTLSLAGVFNMMAEDEASAAYTPEDTNGDTIETILTAIANKTMPCFTHCKSYAITYDTGYDTATQIDTFKPKDYFSVGFKESRLSAFKKALAFCKCKARVENASGVPTIHVFKPVTSGSTYDYEYDDAYGDYHNFFDKSVRKRLVIPNKVIVSNHPDHDDSFTGNATDSASYTALGDRYIIEHHYIRATGNTQCTNLATAIIQNYQLAAERGHGIAPMNCGQEVMDYVLITDSRVGTAGDTRTGNIGFINRWYSHYPRQPTRFGFEFRFGSLAIQGLAGTLPARGIKIIDETATTQTNIQVLFDEYAAQYDRLNELADKYNELLDYLINRAEVIPKLHVTHQLIIPVWIPGAPLVTTEAVDPIGSTTATGNGAIIDLGIPDPTAYGVCWDTSSSPTITDSGSGKWGKTDELAATETGAYTTSMTSLTTGTLYYVRAYATNTTGTGYGIQVTFTTD